MRWSDGGERERRCERVRKKKTEKVRRDFQMDQQMFSSHPRLNSASHHQKGRKKLRRNPFVSESRKLTVTRVSRHTTMDSLYIGQHNYPVLKSVRFSRPSAARLSVWDFHPFNSRWYSVDIQDGPRLWNVFPDKMRCWLLFIWIVEKIRCQYTDERADISQHPSRSV